MDMLESTNQKREKKAYLAGPSPCVRNLEVRRWDEGKEREKESKRETQRNSAEETPAPIQLSYCKHSCFATTKGKNMAATLWSKLSKMHRTAFS